MRLTPEEREIILSAGREQFGGDARIRLFGSRVDDAARGGDIDLYIECDTDDDLTGRKARFLERVWERIGVQRIDLVVRPRRRPLRAIHRDALERGVAL